MALDRRIFNALDDVPEGTKAVGVNVVFPRVVIQQDEDDVPALMNCTMVFVEVTDEEWQEIANDRSKANEIAKNLGQVIAAHLGGYVRCWHE